MALDIEYSAKEIGVYNKSIKQIEKDIKEMNYGLKNHKIDNKIIKKINIDLIIDGKDKLLTLSKEDNELLNEKNKMENKIKSVREKNKIIEKKHIELMKRLAKSENDKKYYIRNYVKIKKSGKLPKDIEKLLSKFV